MQDLPRRLILQDVGRRFREAIPAPSICERRTRIGVPGKVLEVNHIAATLAGGGERCDAERVDSYGPVELQLRDKARGQALDRSACEGSSLESIASPAACRFGRGKESRVAIVTGARHVEPYL